ncbi:hypothetical protein HMF8227_02548 [Saliniradius amylolyticus]|uniref:Cupin type-2 domain-containing protein n=1 Tax=Saliniradius amylolyticus TaxID=2183582 RepID=A0A2S2E6Y1_9ALTE|nr:cupin domain-containing protein [Saliniradius amylolyticus]AWL13000.1 hypothetical protein HMF8227_02548 [Saliniradius amylolyticus]
MKVINTKNATHYRWGTNSDGWHLLHSDELSIIEERVPPGEAEQRHYHKRSQQFFYILSGLAHIEIDAEIFCLHQGCGIHVSPGCTHKLENKSSQELRFLVVSQPHSHSDRVEV